VRIDPSLIDVVLPWESGYSEAMAEEDSRDALCAAVTEAGAVVTDFPDSWLIDPKDWPDASNECDKYRTWPADFIDRFTNQGSGNGGYSTHECTSHGFVRNFESARNRARQLAIGPPVPRQRLESSAKSASVWFSCLSVYSEANPRQWGGANVRQILSIAAKRGVIPDKTQPRDWGFKHQLQGTCGAGGINQSRGSWVSVSDFPAGWEETAKHFKPVEFIFPETFEQTVSLVLRGIAVTVGRSGHCVCYDRWMADDQVMRYPDSYDVFRYDSASTVRRTVGGSYAIVSVTTPDDWEHPTG
jgi:hypothetical protein